MGQKFRLEAATVYARLNFFYGIWFILFCCNMFSSFLFLSPSQPNGEDFFKMGRSTGRLFREKGVSLYKDKEISTTHAKIDMRNGQVFLVDMASTNGTQLNGGEDLDAHSPVLLKNGDIITMGSTELLVTISDSVDDDGDENTCA